MGGRRSDGSREQKRSEKPKERNRNRSLSPERTPSATVLSPSRQDRGRSRSPVSGGDVSDSDGPRVTAQSPVWDGN